MKTTKILSSAFMVAVILAAAALIACGGYHALGYFPMKSYAQLQQEYSKWNKLAIYPDIPDMSFDEATFEYRAFYDAEQFFAARRAEDVELTGYDVHGDGEIDGFSFSCYMSSARCSGNTPPADTCREEGETEELLSYKGVDITVRRSDDFYDDDDEYTEREGQPRDFNDRYLIVVNGSLYGISTTVFKNEACSIEERNSFREKIDGMMYSYICGVIDELQEKN